MAEAQVCKVQVSKFVASIAKQVHVVAVHVFQRGPKTYSMRRSAPLKLGRQRSFFYGEVCDDENNHLSGQWQWQWPCCVYFRLDPQDSQWRRQDEGRAKTGEDSADRGGE